MPGIFISYRRSDSPDATGRLYDRLVAEFGKAQVFKDVDSIPLGRDFRGHLDQIVGDCAAVLAIIGPHWTELRNEAGQRRLEEPDDFVRIELEAALARNIPVVPVLVGHAQLPAIGQMPASLAPLAFRQSIEVRPDPDFHNDATRLVAALRRILDPSAPEVAAAGGASARPADPAGVASSWRGRLPWLAAGVAIGVMALAVPALRHLRESPPPETRLDIVTPATDQPAAFALSPDGRQLVFVVSGEGASRLWLRSLGSSSAQPLAGTEGASFPFWSPDSRSIGFFAAGALKRLDLGGGAPQIIAPATAGRGGSWNADGVILFTPNNASSALMRVAATGGSAVPVTTLGPQQLNHRYPQFLPDGRHFLFYVQGVTGISGIYLGALDGSAPTRLTPAGSYGLYLAPGWLLWARSGTLVAQRLDLSKPALRGEPLTLADGVAEDATRLVTAMSVSANGLVAYRKGSGGERQLAWFDRAGTARGTLGDADGSLGVPRLSRDGRRVVAERVVEGHQDLWLLDGTRTTRLTFDPAVDSYPVWSPDGTRIAYRSFRDGTWHLYQRPANGTGVEEQLLDSGQRKSALDWSADGRFLLYQETDPKANVDLWVLPMTGAHKPVAFLRTPFREAYAVFSPDGRWVAYESNESGRPEVYVRPFIAPDAPRAPVAAGNAAEGQWQVSTAGGITPTWRRDGKEIYYLSPAGEMMAAPIGVSGTTLQPGAPVKLFATHIYGGGTDDQLGRQYDLAPDGRFLINKVLDDTASGTITLIQNWNPQAKPQ